MIPWLVFAAMYLMIGVGVAAEHNQDDPVAHAWWLVVLILIWPVAVGVLIQRALIKLAR